MQNSVNAKVVPSPNEVAEFSAYIASLLQEKSQKPVSVVSVRPEGPGLFTQVLFDRGRFYTDVTLGVEEIVRMLGGAMQEAFVESGKLVCFDADPETPEYMKPSPDCFVFTIMGVYKDGVQRAPLDKDCMRVIVQSDYRGVGKTMLLQRIERELGYEVVSSCDHEIVVRRPKR